MVKYLTACQEESHGHGINYINHILGLGTPGHVHNTATSSPLSLCERQHTMMAVIKNMFATYTNDYHVQWKILTE